MKPTPSLLACAVGAICATYPAMSQASLISYWNFNNVSPAYVSSTLGSFSGTAASYGEAYASQKLSSNTANGTIYSGSGVSLDFANLSAGVNNAIINGKVAGGSSQAQTNTVFGGFGAFTDTTLNRVAGDTSTGGSMIIMNPSGTELGHYLTFTLSSAGYDSLALSYDTRLSNGFAGNEVWSYSLNGTAFSPLGTISPTANSTFSTQSLNLSTLSAGALDNQPTFYLRMTLTSNTNGGSFAFDNIQLTGTSVPEPATLGSLAALAMLIARRRR